MKNVAYSQDHALLSLQISLKNIFYKNIYDFLPKGFYHAFK